MSFSCFLMENFIVSILIIIVYILKLIFKNKISCRLSYFIWLTVLGFIMILLLPLPTFDYESIIKENSYICNESVNEEVQDICGIEVKERVPDSVLQEADEVVNIDLTAEELITRLKAGKIYRPEKIEMALNNFFKTENILQLRELALKEVALRVEKKVENEVVASVGIRHERFMACISSHEKSPRRIIRKVARLATRYNTSFIALYVQTPRESMDRIDLASQRYLLNHFKLVAELGGEVVQVQSKDILGSIVKVCKEKQISTVCMGTPNLRLPYAICSILGYRKFLNNLSQANVDLIILA